MDIKEPKYFQGHCPSLHYSSAINLLWGGGLQHPLPPPLDVRRTANFALRTCFVLIEFARLRHYRCQLFLTVLTPGRGDCWEGGTGGCSLYIQNVFGLILKRTLPPLIIKSVVILNHEGVIYDQFCYSPTPPSPKMNNR